MNDFVGWLYWSLLKKNIGQLCGQMDLNMAGHLGFGGPTLAQWTKGHDISTQHWPNGQNEIGSQYWPNRMANIGPMWAQCHIPPG